MESKSMQELKNLRGMNASYRKRHEEMKLRYARLEKENKDLKEQLKANQEQKESVEGSITAIDQIIDNFRKTKFVTTWVEIVKGDLYDYLKEIPLIGRIYDNKDFVVYGCGEKSEAEFYKGIFDYDKENNIYGFENESDVEKYWTNDADMFLVIANGDYRILEDRQ